MSEIPHSLKPDSEQTLFEKLSMSEDDYKDLEYIRSSMISLLRTENKIIACDTKKNLNTI